MVAHFTSPKQANLFRAIRDKLKSIGYRNGLLEAHYRFNDWFLPNEPVRIARLAAFGQTPPSQESACFAVLPAVDYCGVELIEQYRALGAPYAFEVTNEYIVHWIVGKDRKSTKQIGSFTAEQLDAAFAANRDNWLPATILRAKNISYAHVPRQLELFDHELLPELESRIQAKLDPLVRATCNAAKKAYYESSGKDPDMRQLFKLAFWMLAGKVFFDRGLEQFQQLGPSSSADDVLIRVAKHYGEPVPRLLNQPAREAVHSKMWSRFNFKNLSIDVLARVWADTFVTEDIRETLGIHATPRPIAKFIVDCLPFEEVIAKGGLVVEPCSGCGTFLVAALQRLRDLLPNTTSSERHSIFKRRLIGFETESIGIEISRLCLTLADYPNPNGWKLLERNVFNSRDFLESLSRARVVLCNPPFEDFSNVERAGLPNSPTKKPLELLIRVLAALHPDGMIGFVMPRIAIDGDGYAALRESLAERFRNLNVIALPDNAFPTADAETALIVGHGRKQPMEKCAVHFAKVKESDWDTFRLYQRPSFAAVENKSPQEARRRLSVQPLQSVWQGLRQCAKLGQRAIIKRGLEWKLPLTIKGKETGNRAILVKAHPHKGYTLGVPPQAKFLSFESPPTAYLSMLPEHERAHSFAKPWDRPKIIMNKATKSRGEWRVAAYADFDGLTFYQTFLGIWPHDPELTIPIAAMLNGPIANAFISTLEGKIDITAGTLRQLPIPNFSPATIAELKNLTEEYAEATRKEPFVRQADFASADALLRRIDAVVLQAYNLSGRSERELLDFMSDPPRQVPFPFARYFPLDFQPTISLSHFLSTEFEKTSAERILSQMPAITDPETIAALQRAV
jgi:hypothetical protein